MKSEIQDLAIKRLILHLTLEYVLNLVIERYSEVETTICTSNSTELQFLKEEMI